MTGMLFAFNAGIAAGPDRWKNVLLLFNPFRMKKLFSLFVGLFLSTILFSQDKPLVNAIALPNGSFMVKTPPSFTATNLMGLNSIKLIMVATEIPLHWKPLIIIYDRG